jgi:hypothetical protein
VSPSVTKNVYSPRNFPRSFTDAEAKSLKIQGECTCDLLLTTQKGCSRRTVNRFVCGRHRRVQACFLADPHAPIRHPPHPMRPLCPSAIFLLKDPQSLNAMLFAAIPD